MATITGLTADRMLEIENESIVDGEIVGGNLILTKHDGTTIDAGPVTGPPGPVGPMGPAAVSAIPGEVKIWSGSALPEGTYGHWVWADGTVYVVAAHPIAAGHIAAEWRTFAGASDPGGANFRVPDMRGLIPAGLDAMPGGTRANRMTRAVAITIASKTGEETHVITIPEMPAHTHDVVLPVQAAVAGSSTAFRNDVNVGSNMTKTSTPAGGGGAHENVQPTVFVPYIVFLDG